MAPQPAFTPKLSWRMIGAASPVFPGFDLDITSKVPDHDKPDAIWHRDRAKQIVRAHPKVKELIGNTPTTALYCIAFVVLHLVIAVLLAQQPWWLVLIAAYVLGPWINTNLFMLGHECNHGLVFKRVSWNRWLYTFTTLPMCLSAHHTWWVDHLAHHNDLGSRKDFITRRRKFFLATRRLSAMVFPWGLLMIPTQLARSAVGLVVYLGALVIGRFTPGKAALSILAEEHLISGYRKSSIVHWAVVYPTLLFAMLGGLFWYGGWMPLLYLILSAGFLTGFAHPLMFGLILSNAHFLGSERHQATTSYYGWLNKITLNFGLHTEHHDLAGVPWRRLPQIRSLAPEFYDDLLKTESYTGLTWRFHFGGRETDASQFAAERPQDAVLAGDAA